MEAEIGEFFVNKLRGTGAYTPPFFVCDLSAVPLKYEFLTHDERKILTTLSEKKKREWCAGRYAAKRVVQQVCMVHGEETDINQFTVLTTDMGMPYIVRCGMADQYMVSISHTGEKAVAVTSYTPKASHVGVDLEKIRSLPSHVLQSFLTTREYNEHVGADDPNRDGVWRWCLKESYLKALGVGLRIHPKRVEILSQPFGVSVTMDGVFVPVSAYWTVIDELYMLACIEW